MQLTGGTLKHIEQLALLREAKALPHEDNVELYDSIDCLNMEELSELYAVVTAGIELDVSAFPQYINDAKSKGFSVVGELFNMGKLGSHLKRGAELLRMDDGF